MLANKDIYEEIELAEKGREILKDEGMKILIKQAILQTKLLHNIRTNSTAIMKHFKIPLIEPKNKPVDAE